MLERSMTATSRPPCSSNLRQTWDDSWEGGACNLSNLCCGARVLQVAWDAVHSSWPVAYPQDFENIAQSASHAGSRCRFKHALNACGERGSMQGA